jgi:hypothetical protein
LERKFRAKQASANVKIEGTDDEDFDIDIGNQHLNWNINSPSILACVV